MLPKINNLDDYSLEHAQAFLKLFINMCQWGIDNGLDAQKVAMTCEAIAMRLMVGDHDLQYYVDHPEGDNPDPVTKDTIEQIKARVQSRGSA